MGGEYPQPDPLAQGYDLAAFYSQCRPNNVHSTAYGNALLVKVGQGLLFGFTARSSNAGAQFIQVHDKATAPATGDVPAVVFDIAAVATLGVNWIPCRTFRAGCWVVNSSTAPTYTAGAADTFFDSQFL